MEFIQEHIEASLMLALSNTAEKAIGRGLSNIGVFDLDSHAMDSEVSGDFLTFSGCSIAEDDKLFMVDVAFGAATQNDQDLKKLRRLSSLIFDSFRVDKTYPLVNYENGETIGTLKVKNGTQVLPVSGEDSRPQRGVLVAFTVSPYQQ